MHQKKKKTFGKEVYVSVCHLILRYMPFVMILELYVENFYSRNNINSHV